jgi:hypothetical protein
VLGGVPVRPDERKRVKVLLTGCTAQHISSAVNERIPTFAGLVHKALESQGAEVIWIEPCMEADQDFISMFDSVIVGIASPGSVAANHIYPALWIASLAQRSSKLTLMVDTPEPHKLWAGLSSVAQNPGTLVKDFYARRKGFREAMDTERQETLQGFVGSLVAEEWPLTLAPALPWTDPSFLTRHLGGLAENRSLAIRLDRGLELPIYNPIVESVDKLVWHADHPTSSWTARLAGTLRYPTAPARENRLETAVDISNRLRGSLGLLVTTYRSNEPWWSPLIALALEQRTPIVSEWRRTSALGVEWSQLAASIEDLSLGDREDYAKRQADAFYECIPSFEDEFRRLAESIVPTKKSRR